MKTYRIICLCAAIVIPQAALAEPSVTDQSLGTSQATVDFCTQADPSTAAKYQEQMTQMVKDMSAEELAKLQGSDDYKDAYARTSTALSNIAKPDAIVACSRFLNADN